MRARRNPAVVAGLGVGASLTLPVTAHAVSVSTILEETFSNPVTTFAVGVAGGAAITSLAALAISAARRNNDNPAPPHVGGGRRGERGPVEGCRESCGHQL